jgi:hypothetical protein
MVVMSSTEVEEIERLYNAHARGIHAYALRRCVPDVATKGSVDDQGVRAVGIT